jgi:hypothetical protein
MGSRLPLLACVSVLALAGAPPALASTSSATGSGARAAAAAKSASSHRERASQSKRALTEATATVTLKETASTKGRSTTATTATDPEAPVPVAVSDTPPLGRHMSSNRALQIADALPKMRAVRAGYRGSYGGAYLKGATRWQVSYFSKQGREIGQVIIADYTGHVIEQWTGFQIAWSMARGYPGAFGRHVNALYVWIPLCVLFFLPFFDWRRPLRLLHLDLLVLLSFSVSLAYFNHGRIYASTPLVYPPLIYLLVRMLLLARIGRRRSPAVARPVAPIDPGDGSYDSLVTPGGATPALVTPGEATPALATPALVTPAHVTPGVATPGEAKPNGDAEAMPNPSLEPLRARPPLRLLVPAHWLAVGVVFLVGFRIGLNVTDSNVIDVGYAGVIGAQRIADERPLYGAYPSDNEHGDTYGPVNYETYVPFQQLFGWSGHWDDLPAAHAAAIVFDLLAIALLFLLGRRVRGPGLGIALAYAWVSYPFTLFALESNSNDSLVAVLVLAALLVASSPPARGVFAALAGLTKFAPLALAPLLWTHGVGDLTRPRRARALALFALAFVATVAAVSISALTHDSLHTIYERTLAYQSNRESPFSIWGLYEGSTLGYLQSAVQGAAIALALSVAILPRRAGVVGLAAAAAAVLLAVQLGIDHWFYLYIPWFFGLVMLALLGELNWSGEQARDAPSISARSNQLAAA